MQTLSQAEQPAATQSVNVGHGERIASIALGSGLVAFGLLRRSRTGWGLAATGATLLYSGVRGVLRRLSSARHRPRHRRARSSRQSRRQGRAGGLDGRAGRENLPLLAGLPQPPDDHAQPRIRDGAIGYAVAQAERAVLATRLMAALEQDAGPLSVASWPPGYIGAEPVPFGNRAPSTPRTFCRSREVR